MISTTTAVSELLGYTSIACWLGAQFPQVLENLRRQSCEGLALPFLFNWLLDCTLVAQYFYYSKPTPPRPRPSAVDRGVRYRTLSAVAANVAASAALVAQQDEQADHRRRWTVHSASRIPDDDDVVDDNALAALADSFHSDAGHDHKRVSWSIERSRRRSGSLNHPLHPPSTDSLVDIAIRGRPLERHLGDNIAIDPPITSPTGRNSRAASKRGAGTIMFFGAWALFGIGTFATRKNMASTGTVISPRAYEGQVQPLYEAFATEPFDERTIGRIFAWLCTTLYLTSRLPQIWKNFVRKSVEVKTTVLLINRSLMRITGLVDVSLRLCLFGERVLRGIDTELAQNEPASSRINQFPEGEHTLPFGEWGYTYV
ncbi:hypothetical protein H0H92_000009 [Tricholoma furcatifolium]|nr:hypothetical protein H0H92_000009 [Tricholoma furcatifolium]